MLPDETREEAAINVKAFLNKALEEVSPQLGRIEFVSIPGANSNGLLLFGFANLVDRRGHRAAIDTLNYIEYRGHRLMFTPARREVNINSCRAVREARRNESNLNRNSSSSPSSQAARSRSQPPTTASVTPSAGMGRGILLHRAKVVTFKTPTFSDSDEQEQQQEALLARSTQKNERAARRQAEEDDLCRRQLQLERETKSLQIRELEVRRREEAVQALEASLRDCAKSLAQWTDPAN